MTVQLHAGDCPDVMRGMPDGCVDAVVCDPPCGIAFMRVRIGDDFGSSTATQKIVWLQQRRHSARLHGVVERQSRDPFAKAISAAFQLWATE